VTSTNPPPSLPRWRAKRPPTTSCTRSTLATRNLALVAAAAVMGAVFAAEREATHGVLAPIVTHVTRSTVVLLLLPR